MITKRHFKTEIGRILEQSGFRRRGQSWLWNGPDGIAVVNLQRSNWANEYYVNIGIWLKALGGSQLPEIHECHLSFRLESLFPDHRELILVGCSLEDSSEEILADLSKFFQEEVIPFVKQCTRLEVLRNFMFEGRLKQGLMTKDARELLTS